MRTIKRWLENLSWLFNHPPIAFRDGVPEGASCKYCGATHSLFSYTTSDSKTFTICWPCFFKAMDMVLTPVLKVKVESTVRRAGWDDKGEPIVTGL